MLIKLFDGEEHTYIDSKEVVYIVNKPQHVEIMFKNGKSLTWSNQSDDFVKKIAVKVNESFVNSN